MHARASEQQQQYIQGVENYIDDDYEKRMRVREREKEVCAMHKLIQKQ